MSNRPGTEAAERQRLLQAPFGLRLEPLLPRHAEVAYALLREPALYEFEGEPPASVDALRTRYERLATRLSADGREQWLNWAVFAPVHAQAGEAEGPLVGEAASPLVGLVQATAMEDGCAYVAYQFALAVWGRGWATAAVRAMAAELREHHGAHTLVAVFKQGNMRSRRLLQRLHFVDAPPAARPRFEAGEDEGLMWRAAPEGTPP